MIHALTNLTFKARPSEQLLNLRLSIQAYVKMTEAELGNQIEKSYKNHMKRNMRDFTIN